MPTAVTRTSVDGLPAFVAESDGPARAALAFRVGTSDETLATSGITHAVEHLAMHALGRTVHDSNAFVDPLRTVFYATGEVEEVLTFLREVGAALRALPVERLELERRILLTESARRRSAGPEELLTYRFGPRTYGLRAYEEYGLRRLDGAALEAWTADRFTRTGAALWSSFPLPEDLSLGLPTGERRLPAEPHAVDPLPMRVATRFALGLDCVAPRSTALSTGWRLLRNHMYDVLRTEHALVYDVGVDTERVGADSRRCVLLTDPLPEVRYRAGQMLARTLERVLDEGFSAAELQADTATALRVWSEPGAGLALADTWALDELVGVPSTSVQQMIEAQRDLTPDAVLEAVREAMQTALVALPDEVVTHLPLTPAASWSSSWQPGHTFLPSDPVVQAAPSNRSRRLFVGEGGVTLAFSERDPVTVAWPACAAVLSWEDGSRRLIGDDGFQLVVAPWDWHDGERAAAAVDQAAPTHLVVPMGEGDGPPAGYAPVQPAAPVKRRASWGPWARRREGDA